jgi:hypothetical protein
MRIGVTGHQSLRGRLGWEWIDAAIKKILVDECQACTGVTSLAAGADQHFAEVVLELGGTIEVIVPFADYETRFGTDEVRSTYQRLLRAARAVITLPRIAEDDQACYLAAGQRVVDRAHAVVAVWDGKPAAGLGGTADVVAYAASRGKKVFHINPVGETVTLFNHSSW